MDGDSKETNIAHKKKPVEQRAENLQILIAIGILTLTGTLYAQGLVDFPAIEQVASFGYVVRAFRWFVYATAIFLTLKMITVTLYPISNSPKLLYIHDRVEPFLYVSSPIFIIIVFLIARIVGQIEDQSRIVVLFAFSLLVAVGFGYWYSSEYQKEQEFERIEQQIIDKLMRTRTQSEDSAKPINEFVNWFPSDKRDQIPEILRDMANDQSKPVELSDEKVWISTDGQTIDHLKR